jgi:hypothetical protein
VESRSRRDRRETRPTCLACGPARPTSRAGGRWRRRPASRFAPRAPRVEIWGAREAIAEDDEAFVSDASAVSVVFATFETRSSVVAFSFGTVRRRRAPPAPGRAMPPSETFVALQRLAKRRREDPPGAPRGPGPAPASEPRGASSASQTRGFPTGDGGASLEDLRRRAAPRGHHGRRPRAPPALRGRGVALPAVPRRRRGRRDGASVRARDGVGRIGRGRDDVFVSRLPTVATRHTRRARR